MLAVHQPGLRLVTPTARPPAPTSMLMPTAWSRLSTTLPMTSTDSVSRAPTFPLLALLPPSSMESRLLPLSSLVSRHPLVFEGVQIADTEEVAAAKAAFAEAYAAQEAAVAAAPAERKRRSAQVIAHGLPLPYAHGLVSP